MQQDAQPALLIVRYGRGRSMANESAELGNVCRSNFEQTLPRFPC